MPRNLGALGALAVSALLASSSHSAEVTPTAATADPPEATAPDSEIHESEVERGRYLSDAGNCYSCHTKTGGAPYSGGVPFETPFGTIYSTNITPDDDTGIGTWSKSDLRRAFHEGIAADGRRLFPAFPYTSYTKVSDADVDAIYAFLRTLEPVSYTPPENGFLFSMRWAMRFWNALFFEQGRFAPDSTQTEEWNRGAYLVEGLGHCSACHTPRNFAMAEASDRAYQGARIMDHGATGKSLPWFAVDLTQSRGGLASWSVDDLTQYLHQGYSSRAGTFGPMNDVTVNSTTKLTEADARAMATYLKSLPAREYTGLTVSAEVAEEGAALYEEHCEECHSASGRGGMFSAPPLEGSAIVQAADPASLINVILYAPQTPEEVSFGLWETMPSYADKLTDAEVAAIGNYVRGSWENVGGPVTEEDVREQR